MVDMMDRFVTELSDCINIKKASTICILGYENEMVRQMIAEFALNPNHEYGLNQWTNMGWMMDVEIIDNNGKTEIKPIESAKVYDLEKAIEQVLSLDENGQCKLDQKELFVFEPLSYKDITPSVISLIQNNLVNMQNKPGKIIIFAGGHNSSKWADVIDDILNDKNMQQLFALNNVEHLCFGLPTLEERKNIIAVHLKYHQEIVISEEVYEEDGTVTTITLNHDFDNDVFISNLASMTEGLSLTQVVMCLAYSSTANRGVIDAEIVKKTAQTIRYMNNGKENMPKNLFVTEVLDIQTNRMQNNYLVDKSFAGYAYRLLLEYMYARWSVINFLTDTEDGGTQLLEDIFVLMERSIPSRRKPIIKYNNNTGTIEYIKLFEEHEENQDLFKDLHDLLYTNDNKLSIKQILKWYKETNNDDFILYIQNFVAQNPYELTMIKYISDVEQVSYKNLIITHKDKQVTDYIIGGGYAYFTMS